MSLLSRPQTSGTLDEMSRARVTRIVVGRLAERDAVNLALHQVMGVTVPCDHACTHLVSGEWTCLGLANLAGLTS